MQYDTDCDDNSRALLSLEQILDSMLEKAIDNPPQKIKFTNNPDSWDIRIAISDNPENDVEILQLETESQINTK